MQKKLSESGIASSAMARFDYRVTPENGTPFEDILRSEYWSHVAESKLMRAGTFCRLEVIPADRSYLAELIVVDCGPQWADVRVLAYHEIAKLRRASAPDEVEGEEFKADFTPGSKWRVLRKSDKAVMVSDLASKDDAELWIKKRRRPVAA